MYDLLKKNLIHFYLSENTFLQGCIKLHIPSPLGGNNIKLVGKKIKRGRGRLKGRLDFLITRKRYQVEKMGGGDNIKLDATIYTPLFIISSWMQLYTPFPISEEGASGLVFGCLTKSGEVIYFLT